MLQRTDLIKNALLRGVWKGWLSFLWMAKILIPISLFTALLQWSGLLSKLNFVLAPIMGLFHLPPAAAFPILSGALTSVYGGIAAMIVLPFTKEQMTLMAIFILIAHNMIQEGVVQAKSGLNPIKATFFRLMAAAVTVAVVARILDNGPTSETVYSMALTASEPFSVAMQKWFSATLHLTVKIFGIIMTIIIILELMKDMGWIDHIVSFFAPMLRIMGLSKKVGILWITAVVFGLAYGAAVIVEEARKGDLTKENLEVLHLSIGINHSMVEDPALFVALGLSPFWIMMPRLITAILAVHLLRAWMRYRQRQAAFG